MHRLPTVLLVAALASTACDDEPSPADATPAADAAADMASDGMTGPLDDGIADMAPDGMDAMTDDGITDMALDATVEPIDATIDATVDAEVDARIDAEPPDLAVDAGEPDLYLPDFGVFELCANGVDDDDDGLIDCGDPDCRGTGACFHAREDCGNGIDDDGDRHADCDDAYCLEDPRCPPPAVEPYTVDDIQRRFDAECVGCHGPVDPFSGLDLSEPFEVRAVDVPSGQVRGMQLVKPGDRHQSFIYYKLNGHHLDVGGDGEGMPQGGERWSAGDVERFARWIEALGSR